MVGAILYQQKPLLVGNHLYTNKISDDVGEHRCPFERPHCRDTSSIRPRELFSQLQRRGIAEYPNTPSAISITLNRVLRIAPRPESISKPQKARDEKEVRKEARKIRKREAAARSYQRKLAKTKAITPQCET